MSIDWNAFTPVPAVIGGLLIGLASGIYILGNGRIAGIAGIVASPLRTLLSGRSLATERTRLFFIGGLLLAPWLWRLAAPLPGSTIDVGWTGVIVAGLLVGFGVRMGGGCTSGHGVCGLSRFSLRSLANVLAFMATGCLTVYVVRHWQ
jgi:uncharacterized protein